MQILSRDGGFDLILGGRPILSHRSDAPFLFVGRGEERMEMYRGNFDIEDYVTARIPLTHAEVAEIGEGWRIAFAAGPGQKPLLSLTVTGDARGGQLAVAAHDPSLNRFWLRIVAEAGEHVFGGGEQMSYFDLAGRRFPLWTSEPGVGRDKTSAITFEADRTGRAGGDYYNTNYPQPTYLSSRRYALHLETTAYSVFDFRHDGFHEIEAWAMPERIELFARDRFTNLVTALSERFGRQPRLPDWALTGAIVGLKDGANSFARLERYIEAGARVSALWCEDWVGLRETSFGKRLFWDWKASDTRYPDLKRRIAELNERGIRFLGYVNPYLCNDGSLFPEAEAKGFLATDAAGATYLVDFGEFDCGVVDFTDEAACRWFEDRVIGENMIDHGLSGWMADFGEYLPIDLKLKSDADARLMHNRWPVLWGEVNARAVERKGRTGDIVFFMRAGYSGIQEHCPLIWAGDQSVDFSRHDGLVTVIVGALSCGLLGNAYHHSDIGGYTSLFGNVRSAELLKRWAEMAAFTSVMRTHEGNRPGENLQIDQNAEVLTHFARMTRIHAALAPYLGALADEAAATGLPLQRPLFLHHEDDPRAFAVWDAYLLGPDLLVAPVWRAGETRWTTYLPSDTDWVHLWSGERFAGGTDASVEAPFGEPPVFYREGSEFSEVFAGLRGM
ncbi:alpha-glucosidase [Aurantimonas sp. VKM B-3413]|uniref:alpha-glucosidase n=1 Tax=Aurantimonas sp. VKM B-3413 TaxID=2779401 RepID=UPI001E41526D|nr:alpha-glucosidase [Aurantimonas sp. VKM B-3413]MCB8838798.1 alpha-glucosidase [Aurantimonas sp. VKM B-3413]